MRRILSVVLVVLGVTTVVMVASPAVPASAATPVVVGPTTVAEAGEYRTDVWGDPWDFSGESDAVPPWHTDPHKKGKVTSISGGQLHVSGPGDWFEVLQTLAYPPTATDALSRPLDTSKYQRVSFRMWSASARPIMFQWYDCELAIDCDSQGELWLQQGWHTYDIDPATMPLCCGQTQRRHPWNRPVGGIRLWTGDNQAVHLDWFRIYEPTTAPTSVDVGPESVDEVWWDADNNQNNNVDSPTADVLSGPVAANGTVAFDTDAYPPGTYRFYTVKAGVKSPYSEPVTVNPKPLPVIIDPDMAGGDDWASVVRRDPWDFSQLGDLSGWANTGPGNPAPSISNGVLNVNPAGSDIPGDSSITLSTPTDIDARLYHRLSVRQLLTGNFDLGHGPGGGTMGRFLWQDETSPPHAPWRNSQDIIEKTGVWNTITLDLHTNPRSAIEDETSPDRRGVGVPGRERITELRWDPHEDPGGRRYSLDWIRLARNDRGKPNFGVRFEDRRWVDGTVADIYLDTDAVGFNGTRIASDIPVRQGTNTYNLRQSVLASGTRYVYIVMKSPLGTQTATYSSGPVDMGTWNGFIDVPPSHAFRSQIDWLTAELIAEGYDDNSFRPSGPVSRQAVASFLWKYAGSPASGGSSFPDVPPGHVFHNPIRWLVTQQIATGFGDGTFKPTAPVTRQALASFLYKLAGSPPVDVGTSFKDVPGNHPFAAAITWLAQKRIASGYDDGTFRPGAVVSRQAVASMVAKYAALQE